MSDFWICHFKMNHMCCGLNSAHEVQIIVVVGYYVTIRVDGHGLLRNFCLW